MLKIKKQGTLPFTGNSEPLGEINKHQKRVHDFTEDAEIEAEIEAEKKTRSKNLRMFSISVIGVGLLGLVYFQVSRQTTISPVEPTKEAQANKPETVEEKLAKQMASDVPSASGIPVPPSTGPAKPNTNPVVTAKKTESTAPPAGIKEEKPSSTKKTPLNPEPKSSPGKTPSATKKEKSGFFIQTGAFSVKKNAESFLKQLQLKGFAPFMQTRSRKMKQYVITVGNFTNTKSGEGVLKELNSKGINASFYENSDNSFSLKVGQFKNLTDAQKLQARLSLKGFLSDSHRANVPVKIHTVQLGVFPNREKALLAQKKLAQSGYPETFLR